MLKFLGLVFVTLLGAGALVALDYFLPGSFLMQFMGSEFVQTFATIFGFNIAAIVFLLGQLLIVDPGKGDHFVKTKTEIKENAVFFLLTFCLSIVLLVVRPDYNASVGILQNKLYTAINVLAIALFEMALYMIYEILSAAFVLSKKF